MRWLHVSDIHFNPDMDGRSSAQLREQLPEYLTELGVKVDEVFVTGDFRFARDQEDTDEVAEAAIAYVRKIAGSVGVYDTGHIHIVPGNHDLDRYLDTNNKRKLTRIRKKYSPDSGLIAKDDLDFLLKRFSFFKRVYAKLYPVGPVWSDNLLPIHNYCCFDGYNLLYINTAITCNKDDERGELIIGNNDLYRALEEIKKRSNGAPTIALAHHAIECLSKREREEVEKLLRDYSVRLYLCGDSHEVWCRPIYQTAEITMGCLKQGNNVQATFSIGELRLDGYITVDAHLWDSRMGGWGPYTQFNQRIKEILPQPPSAPTVPGAKVFGRDALIDEVSRELRPGRAVAVHGPPGIGKSTVCRAVIEGLASGAATEVDLTQKETISLALTAILDAFNEKPSDSEPLERQIEALCRRLPGHILYLDNMEDPLQDENFKNWFLSFIRSSGWTILYSSRKHMNSRIIRNIYVPILEAEPAKSMFLHLWEEKLSDNDLQMLEELLTDLDRHPLSIYLVAAQKWRLLTVGNLLQAWQESDTHTNIEFEDSDDCHRSLHTALTMSYSVIKDNREALILWGVMSYLPESLSCELFDEIFSDNLPAYSLAGEALLKNGLIELREDKTPTRATFARAMLAPIKNIVFLFEDTIKPYCVERLRAAFTKIFVAPYQRDHTDYKTLHHLALACLSPALAFLERTKLDSGQNESLAKKMKNYYQYSASASLDVLRSLEDQSDVPGFLAFLFKYMGDLESRLGRIEAAQKHYADAEKLYRDERAMLGLANVLKAMGDLESRLGQIEDAQKHYTDAEKLYRDERTMLGLANVLKAMGNLEREQKNYDVSIEHYEYALQLYISEQEPMGKCYVMGELCRVYALAEKKEKALQILQQIKSIFDQMPEYVRSYVTACIEEASDSLGITWES